MSRDASVWLTCEVDLENLLATLDGRSVDEFGNEVFEGENWQVLVGPLDRVEPEDVPDQVLALDPSISHVVGLTLEGSGRGAGGRLLRELERGLATAGRGIIDDSNDRDLVDADGNKHRVQMDKRGRQIDVMRFSWFWGDESPTESSEGLLRLLTTVEDTMPEALPKRYDVGEPPQLRFEDGGVAALASYLHERRDEMTVMYAVPPFYEIDLSHPRTWASDAGFRAHRLTIDVEATAVHRPGWGARLSRLFVGIAGVAEPFYAETRVLRGLELTGREPNYHTLFADLDPVERDLWRGIPNRVPIAAVIGPPYIGRWPEFERAAEDIAALKVICSPDLARPTELVPPAPAAIRQKFDRRWVAGGSHWAAAPVEVDEDNPMILTRETAGLIDIMRTLGAMAQAPRAPAVDFPFN